MIREALRKIRAQLKTGVVTLAGQLLILPFTVGATYLITKYVLSRPTPRIHSLESSAEYERLVLDHDVANSVEQDPVLVKEILDNLSRRSVETKKPCAVNFVPDHDVSIPSECADTLLHAVGEIFVPTIPQPSSPSRHGRTDPRQELAKRLWRAIHQLADAPQRRTGEITVVPKVINDGDSDFLISEEATLKCGDVVLTLTADSPVTVKSHSVNTITFVVGDRAVHQQEGAFEKWRRLINQHQEIEFDVTLSVEGRKVSYPGAL